MRRFAVSSMLRMKPANSSGTACAVTASMRLAASITSSCARAGNTTNDTTRPTTAPTATSITRSKADAIGPAWVMVGPKNTMTAVNGAALKRGFVAARRAAGPTAIARVPNSAISSV